MAKPKAEEVQSDAPEIEVEAAPESPPVPPPLPTSKKIMLVVDHVFLPIDRLTQDWHGTSDTEKVPAKGEDGKRTRFDVSASLADFLESRDQAEILE